MSLSGQTVVVIGGSSGIGLAIAKLAARENAGVVLAAANRDRLERARREIEAEAGAGGVEIRQVEVGDEGSVQALFEELGVIDHLATPGSGVMTGRVDQMPVAEARASFDSKFWGQYYCVRHAKVEPLGSITLFSGTLSRKPMAGYGTISTINAAVEALGKALALEVAPVRVNVVAPGLMDTAYPENESEPPMGDSFENFRNLLQAHRICRPEDVAEAVVTMMKNPYVTGTVLDVDGSGLLVQH